MNDRRYAGFWLRVAASLIDNIVFVIVAAIASSLFLLVKTTDPLMQGVIVDVIMIAGTLYLWHRYGGTPGKRVLHVKIVDAATGDPLRHSQAAFRFLGYFVSTFTLGLGFLWVAFDKRKQGFHDKIAGTVVIRD